jgi:hypothetical protein
LGYPNQGFSNRDGFRQRLVRLPIQRTNRRRLEPADEVVMFAETFSTAKIRRSVGLQTPDEIDATLLEQ